MKKYIYKIFSLLLLIGVMTSCEDKLLTTVNPNSMTDVSFWKSKSDFDKGLNALYGSLQLPSISGTGLTYEILRSDLAGTEAWYGVQQTFTTLRYNDGTEYVNSRWSQLYVGIFRANQILHQVEAVKNGILSADEKTLISAQCKFVRGFCYFWLANGYNGAVIHNALPISPEDMHKPFSDKKVVLEEMVIPDLTAAAEGLPIEWTDSKDLGRYTKGAALAMLGKTYLFEKKFTEAQKFFKEVIDLGIYSLVPNYMDNFTTDNEFNAESVLEISFSDGFKPGTNGGNHDEVDGSEATGIASSFCTLYAGGWNSTLPTYSCQELFVSGEEMDPNNPWTATHLRSMRTYATLVVEFADGDYYKAPLTPFKDPETGKLIQSKANFNYGQSSKIKKWTQWDRVETEDASTGCRTGINYRAIRYADVLLMYAETLLETNKLDEAIAIIDQVRERAGVIKLSDYMANNAGKIPQLHISGYANGTAGDYSYVTADVNNVKTHLRMVERVAELAFEGHRWYDLVRWGIGKEVFDLRWEEEKKLRIHLCGGVDNQTIPATWTKEYPLYLNERVRPDFQNRSEGYSSAAHDYFPIPTCEKGSNMNL